MIYRTGLRYASPASSRQESRKNTTQNAFGGAALGYADGDDVCENEGHCILTFSAVDKATIGAVVFGVIGGGIGGAIGLIRGSRYIYSYGEQIRVTPSGPPGSVMGATITF